MKKIFSLLLIVTSCVFSQAPTEIPNYTPPSPQAHALTKYGDIPANEYTGKVNTSIPLYVFKTGKLELPITLNYSGAGVKVNDLATWTGINWVLSAGGVITRTVNDVPDEMAMTRLFYSDLMDMVLHEDSQDAEYLYTVYAQHINSTQVDTRPDIFNFSFGNYSGSFYLDEEMQPRITSKSSEITISIVDGNLFSSKQFLITTADGVQYLFGGVNAHENSKLTHGWHQTVTNISPTAFYLKQIVHPIAGQLDFEYESAGYVYVNYSESFDVTKLSKNLGDAVNFSLRGCFTNDSSNPNQTVSTNPLPYGNFYVPRRIKNEIPNMLFLKKITALGSTQQVIFNSATSPNSQHLHYERYLNNILIKVDSNTFRTIDFEYDFSTTRFFLNKVIFDKDFDDPTPSQDGRPNQQYEMEYNSGLPPRFSYAQDHLGYYNGEIDNQTLLPKNDDVTFSLENEFGADRTPHFAFAKAGSLSKLYYPTGGYTEFEYESVPNKRFEKGYGALRITRGYYNNEIPKLTDTFLEWGPAEVTEEPVQILYGTGPPYSQTITINCVLNASEVMGHQDKVYVKLQNAEDPNDFEEKFFVMDLELINGIEYATTTHRSFTFYVYGDKKYFIELRTDLPGSSVPMEVRATIIYSKGLQIVDGAGVRVKKITDYASNNSPENIKRYYYGTKESLLRPEIESIPFLEEPNYINYYTHVEPCRANNPFNPTGGASLPVYEPEYWYFKTLNSSPVNFREEVDRVYPSVVISLGGDQFERGGIEKKFFSDTRDNSIIFKEASTDPLFGSPDPNIRGKFFESDKYSDNAYDFANGTLVKETHLKKISNSLHKLSETSYEFITKFHKSTTCISGGMAFKHYKYWVSGYSNYQFRHYGLFSKTLIPVSTISKQYIDPLPLTALSPEPQPWNPQGDCDNDGIVNFIDDDPCVHPDAETIELAYRKIINTETFEYDSYAGQITESTVSKSDGGTLTTKYFYVDLASENELPGGDLSSDSTENTAYQQIFNTLKNNHIVNSPIQIETYNNGELLSRTRTLYADFPSEIGGDPGLDLFPNKIQSSKGSLALEDRIVFEEYDESGNPILLGYANGPKVFYRYNLRNQVTRKIENYTGMTPQPEIPEDYDAGNLPPPDNACAKQTTYPGALVTDYYYDVFGNLLRIDDPRCRQKTFHYDARHKLVKITDDENNIIEEYDYNYKRY